MCVSYLCGPDHRDVSDEGQFYESFLRYSTVKISFSPGKHTKVQDHEAKNVRQTHTGDEKQVLWTRLSVQTRGEDEANDFACRRQKN